MLLKQDLSDIYARIWESVNQQKRESTLEQEIIPPTTGPPSNKHFTYQQMWTGMDDCILNSWQLGLAFVGTQIMGFWDC